MAKWLARGERCGWSRGELARRSGHPAWKLRWWQKRFAHTPALVARGRAFVAVEVTESRGTPSPAITILTPSGYRLEVGSEIDPEHLRRVVAALEPRC